MNKSSFLSVLILFVLSCDNSTRFVEYPITNSAIRNALSYQKGSYFIYKDSLSGIKDSIWVNTQFNNWVSVSLGDNHFENIETIGYKLNDSLGEVGYVSSDGTGGKGDNYLFQGGLFQTSSNIFSNHFVLNQVESGSQGYSLYTNYYDSIIINGNKYFGVLESYQKSTKYENKAFFSLSSGIIKCVIKSDSSNYCWELSKFHIE